MSFLVATLIGSLVGALISGLIGAAIIRFATRLLLHFAPSFRSAFAAALLGALGNSALGYAVGFGAAAFGKAPGVAGFGALALSGWFIYSAVIARLIKHPDSAPIGFRNALLLGLVAMLFGVLFGATLSILLRQVWR